MQEINRPLFYTGHSLGAALATLAAGRFPPRALYTFGSPRVGDGEFATTLEGVPTFRLVNNRDLVTGVPRKVGRVRLAHVGQLRQIEPDSSVRDGSQLASAGWHRHPSDRRRWFDPPWPVADHAPGNYVAHLARIAAGADLVI
jgi:hypothetical protein